ncbi:hypothetical protein Pyn_11094 [Prunus yedoensis var. nudiflora]|uniref:Uncharacterized protein n=1 Tax=Prunus yedoensis var. nudiflora TaxID=2094558 RepID=A0A314Z7I1_PRUYE|nr:hypothetical protein Pyn_11094 [Prunus yedoensis var. nudiflora]
MSAQPPTIPLLTPHKMGKFNLSHRFSMVFFMLILQVFYGNMVQWDDGGGFSCASFVCLDEEGLD